MIYVIAWMAGATLAFVALRHFALRDFGAITVGGLIGLAMYSLIAPCALVTAFLLSLQGRGAFLGRVVWRRK